MELNAQDRALLLSALTKLPASDQREDIEARIVSSALTDSLHADVTSTKLAVLIDTLEAVTELNENIGGLLGRLIATIDTFGGCDHVVTEGRMMLAKLRQVESAMAALLRAARA